MVNQERLRSAYSAFRKHKKDLAVLTMVLSSAAISCIKTSSESIAEKTENTGIYRPTANPKISPDPKSFFDLGMDELTKEGCPNTSLGIRVDRQEIMEDPKKLCLGAVRIQIDPNTFYKDPQTKQAISRAKELGYSVLCSLVTHSPTKNEVELAVRIERECDMVQIGNEVDNKIIPFWEESEKYKQLKADPNIDKNTLNEQILDEFTDHFVDIYSGIRKVNPEIQIIVGANVDVGLTIRTLQILSSKGISLDDVYISVHLYNTTEDVRQRIGFLSQHFNTGKIVVTEAGAKNDDKRKLVDMLKTIKQIDKRIRTFIHELSDEEGFGCIDPNQGKLDKKCLPIKEFALDDLKQYPQHRYKPVQSEVFKK